MSEEKEMGFLDHLEEMRMRIIRSMIAIFVVAMGVFTAKDIVFDKIIFGPHKPDFLTFRALCKMSELLGLEDRLCVTEINYEIINTTMVGNFTAHIVVSLIGGFIVAFPFIYYQAWAFVKPGMKKKEVQNVRGVVFWASFLFFSGVLFGYFVISPLSLQFLGNYELGEVLTKTTVMSYMKTVASITLAAGLIFQLPVLVYFLTKIGIVTPELLKKFRKHALVAVLVLSAIITPPDVASQVLVAVPVLFLYEISIMISRRVIRSKTAVVKA